MSSFRKRNVVISKKGEAPVQTPQKQQSSPGIRPSPVTGHPTTSTGTSSLDKLLGLGAGLALGSSLLIEEEGTTEFARSLLSCYAAEGVLQGHAVFVVGAEGSLSLPGLADAERKKGGHEEKKMKIAWRYERLGEFGERERGPSRQQTPASDSSPSAEQQEAAQPFCHSFDLTKRLSIPSSCQPPKYLAPSSSPTNSPFTPIITALTAHLASSITPTRLIIPALLSPLIYSPTASQPHNLLTFLHQLRSLLRQFTHLTAILTWPLALFPSTSPHTRYSRHLSDGVITLRPFPHSFSIDAVDLDSGGGGTKGKAEEKMQGLIKVLKLPVLTEKGLSVGVGEDMAFAVGRRRFLIRPFHLPPLEEEDEGGGGGGGDREHSHSHSRETQGKVEAKSLEF